ncbi:MAG TPA: iron-containing alcohol dehydrogenase [bacterium]|nr:iron-containing alcohol dehydrogenase [bacterium]
MESFVYSFPTRIRFGRGQFDSAGQEAAALGKSALVLSGAQDKEAVDQLTQQLNAAGVKAGYHVVEGVQATLPEAQKAAKAGRDAQAALVIAVGDGTVQDTARLVAFGLYEPDRLWDQLPREGTEGRLERVVPILAIPTVPSCSASTEAGGALTNPATGERVGFSSDQLLPKAMILDATLTFATSREATCDAAQAMMGSLLDDYLFGADNAPIQDKIAEGCIETIMENLPVVLSNPSNYSARANLLWTAAVAQSGMASVGRGGNRPMSALARTLAGTHGLPPGRAMGVVMPAAMLAHHSDNAERIARLGHRLFGLPIMSPTMEEAAAKGVQQLKKWFHQHACYHTLQSVGVTREQVAALSEATAASVNGTMDAERIAAIWQFASS